MKRIFAQAMVSLGAGGKLNDTEYDKLSEEVKSLEKAVEKYEFSAKSLVSGAKTLSEALSQMSNTFSYFSSCCDNCSRIKNCDSAFAVVSLSAKSHYVRAFCNALGTTVLTDLKATIKEVKKLDEKRSDALKKLLVITNLVHGKEQKYQERNESIENSKKYEQMVYAKGVAKREFETADTEYKDAATALVLQKETFLSNGMFACVYSSMNLFSNLFQDMQTANKKMEGYKDCN